MHAGLLALIEFVFVLLIGVIIYNSSQGKNAQLSLHLNLVILFLAIIKLVFLLYMTHQGISVCSMAQTLYC
jgi:fumarate reductase subunit C